jgi:hypothetical protein
MRGVIRSKSFLCILFSLLMAVYGCSSDSSTTDAGLDGNGSDGGTDGGTECLPTAATCQQAAECCSGLCVDSVCMPPDGLCTELGGECVDSAECCSGRCEADVSGNRICVLGGGCAGVNQPCVMAIDCCSFNCTGGVCVEDGLCAMIGEDCTVPSDCCSNLCGEDSKCESGGNPCVALGELCVEDSSCCSGNCSDIEGTMRCILTSVCRGEGDICDEGGDCCSGVCSEDNICPVLSECQTVGEPCTGFHECCSGVCADPGTGAMLCQYPSGCRSIGEVCLENGDCCGEQCVPVGDTGVLRCEKTVTPGCLFPGEVCGGSAYGNSNNCCPPGAGGGPELCLPTEIGITRCFGEGTNIECLDDGEPCAFSDECCNGFCLPDENGDLFCGSTCVPLGGECTTHADCCADQDLICTDGTCQPNPYGCVPIGGECENSNDCCAGDCLNGVCIVT